MKIRNPPSVVAEPLPEVRRLHVSDLEVFAVHSDQSVHIVIRTPNGDDCMVGQYLEGALALHRKIGAAIKHLEECPNESVCDACLRRKAEMTNEAHD